MVVIWAFVLPLLLGAAIGIGEVNHLRDALVLGGLGAVAIFVYTAPAAALFWYGRYAIAGPLSLIMAIAALLSLWFFFLAPGLVLLTVASAIAATRRARLAAGSNDD